MKVNDDRYLKELGFVLGMNLEPTLQCSLV